MAFTNDPQIPRDRVRIRVGDTDPLNEYVADTWYDYYLQENSQNETLTALDIAKIILAKFASCTREKVDQVEIWGNDKFDNYLEWLKEFVENPALSGLGSPCPYASGISISDMESYKQDPDVNSVPFSVGETASTEDYYNDGYYRLK